MEKVIMSMKNASIAQRPENRRSARQCIFRGGKADMNNLHSILWRIFDLLQKATFGAVGGVVFTLLISLAQGIVLPESRWFDHTGYRIFYVAIPLGMLIWPLWKPKWRHGTIARAFSGGIIGALFTYAAMSCIYGYMAPHERISSSTNLAFAGGVLGIIIWPILGVLLEPLEHN